MIQTAFYCRFCGNHLRPQPSRDPSWSALTCDKHDCVGFGRPDWSGPALLVQTFVFAQSQLLLMKRGMAPYVGAWAPPGGYMEPFESPEEAAVRETVEEVGLQLDPKELLPLGIVSIAHMNQVYLSFVVRIHTAIALDPKAPEALDVRWFPKSALPIADIWAPFLSFDLGLLFDRVSSGRFEFYQRTDEFLRVISGRDHVTYLRGWKQPER